MTTRVAELTREILALPAEDRREIARQIRGSLDNDDPVFDGSDRSLYAEIMRRDEELTSGTVQPRTHEEVMKAARRAIQCE
jgi:putative addiction module component (TIGR02574 family)